MPEYLRDYFTADTQFHYYAETEYSAKEYRRLDSRFVCLKSFASSTPLVNSAAFQNGNTGGGFFFRFNGRGIVVDPGINFAVSMHSNHIYIDDIDYVIVTHNHLDHNSDLQAISSLLHDYNRAKAKDTDFYKDFFPESNRNRHHIKWILDEGTKEASTSFLQGEDISLLSQYLDCDGENRLWEGKDDEDYVTLNSIRTQHIAGCNDTYGIRIGFITKNQSTLWGYTSDTAYVDRFESFYSNCDALILNISDIYEKDVLMIKPKHSHLGFMGCANLIASTQPKISIISEFCCTNGDYRFEIVRALREQLVDSQSIIVPSDQGMNISLFLSGIECTSCHSDAPIQSLRIVRPEKEYSRFKYLCPNCLL